MISMHLSSDSSLPSGIRIFQFVEVLGVFRLFCIAEHNIPRCIAPLKLSNLSAICLVSSCYFYVFLFRVLRLHFFSFFHCSLFPLLPSILEEFCTGFAPCDEWSCFSLVIASHSYLVSYVTVSQLSWFMCSNLTAILSHV